MGKSWVKNTSHLVGRDINMTNYVFDNLPFEC